MPLSDPLSGLPDEARAVLKRSPHPDWMSPMLATLTDRRFCDPGWIFERKLDGERCLAFRHGSRTRLLSRNRLSVANQYPEVLEALSRQVADDFVVDGEIVAFEGSQPSFARLQRRMHLRDPELALRTRVPVFYYVFDVLYVSGYDTTGLALRHRKAVLRRLLSLGRPLRLTTYRKAQGEAYWREACGKGWEGVIAKRVDAPYEHRRSGNWLKFKCVNEQEFVIGGYTEPKGSREALGALLLGYHENGELRYGGKVGTGFNRQMLRDLLQRLQGHERDRPAFTRGGPLPRKGVHWVDPVLVAEIGFSEWTEDGQLRHPRFLGLRQDKDPRDVVRERPS
jgi:bifunctional non-homologous end joining protein LigD